MKTLDDLKSALNTITYYNTFGQNKLLGTPEGIQSQFDAAEEFPVNVSYLDLGEAEDHLAVEVKTLTLDEDGNVLGDVPSVFIVKD